MIRAVQQARKDAELDVSDRIALTLGVDDAAARAAIEAHRDLIAGETLATALHLAPLGAGDSTPVGEGAAVTVEVSRA